MVILHHAHVSAPKKCLMTSSEVGTLRIPASTAFAWGVFSTQLRSLILFQMSPRERTLKEYFQRSMGTRTKEVGAMVCQTTQLPHTEDGHWVQIGLARWYG